MNLRAAEGDAPIEAFYRAYPELSSIRYTPERLDLDAALDSADLVLVHEWNDHHLVARIGAHRARASRPYVLLFHDTHHRSVTDADSIGAYDLRYYDGVLAFRRAGSGRVPDPRVGGRGRGRGTKPPTSGASIPAAPIGARATSSGSATGATMSGRRSCGSS